MRFFYLLLMFTSSCIVNAQIDWKRSSATGNIPTWMGTVNTERGTAALGDKIYVVSRKSGNLIKVINGTNGTDLVDVSNYSGVSGGTFALNDVEVSSNGAILACNLTETSNSTAFKVYRWNSETDTPSVYISYQNTGATADNLRLGDSFTVTGDISGNAVIMAGGQVSGTSGSAAVHKIVQWIVTGGVLGIPTVITLSPLGMTSGNLVATPETISANPNFFIKSNGRSLYKCNSNGTVTTETTSLIALSSNDIKYFEVGTKKYIAAFTYGTGGENVKLIDVTFGLLSATTIASTPTLGTTANGNGTGGLGIKTIPDPLGGSNNSIIVYALSTNNGISATTLVDNGTGALAAPIAVAQSVCSPGTVANLTATGTNLKWYTVATGGNALATSTAVVTGTYYVSQTVSNIESARTSVAVTVTASTTNGSVTQSQVGGTYKWPANGITYTSSITTTYVSGCNTATLNLTITPDPNTIQVVVKGIKGVWVTNVASTALNSL